MDEANTGWDASEESGDEQEEVVAPTTHPLAEGDGVAAATAEQQEPEAASCAVVLCGASSQDVRWLDVMTRLDGDLPMGPWCWQCGTAMEVWPLMTKQDVAAKVAANAAFRKEFTLVRDGVEAAFKRLLPRKSVFQHQRMGCRTVFRVAFVQADIVAAKFMQAVEGLDVPIVTRVVPDGNTIKGVLFRMDTSFRSMDMPH